MNDTFAISPWLQFLTGRPGLALGHQRSLNSVRILASERLLTGADSTVVGDAEPDSIGEDEEGNGVDYNMGEDNAVRIASSLALTTRVTFSVLGTYHLRLSMSDGKAIVYHTVFIEVRK